MLNILDTKGLQAVIDAGQYQPDQLYSIFINGDQFYFFQKERFSLVQEMGILTSYSMTFTSVDFSVPLDYNLKLIPNQLTSNIIDIFKGKNLIFHGYITEKKIDYCLKYIDFKAVTFLNLLSKYPIQYGDTVATDAVSLLTARFQDILNILPVNFTISTQIANRHLLDGIALGLNTGTSSPNGIDVINNLCDLLDVGIYVENNVINLYALPEKMTGKYSDISPYLDKPAEVEQKTAIYYNQYSMTYKLSYNGSNETNPVVAGNGTLIKAFTPENVFFVNDGYSAQAIVNRKLNIFSKNWHSFERMVNRASDLKCGDMFFYEGFNFITTSVEDKYIGKQIKAVGVEA
jgi:hypothetical protein